MEKLSRLFYGESEVHNNIETFGRGLLFSRPESMV